MIKLRTLKKLIEHMDNLESDNKGIIDIFEIENGVGVHFNNKFNNRQTYHEYNQKLTAIEELDFCSDFTTKINWLIKNGFKKEICNHRGITTYTYKGYVWTEFTIKDKPLNIIKRYKDWYDGLLSEDDLNEYIINNS